MRVKSRMVPFANTASLILLTVMVSCCTLDARSFRILECSANIYLLASDICRLD